MTPERPASAAEIEQIRAVFEEDTRKASTWDNWPGTVAPSYFDRGDRSLAYENKAVEAAWGAFHQGYRAAADELTTLRSALARAEEREAGLVDLVNRAQNFIPPQCSNWHSSARAALALRPQSPAPTEPGVE